MGARKKEKKPRARRRTSAVTAQTRKATAAVAAATKKIGFKFTGAWDQWGAAVDDSDRLGSPDDSRELTAGAHTLTWALTGAPGAAYSVSITGCSPKDWSRDFTIGDDGRAIGGHPFQVAP